MMMMTTTMMMMVMVRMVMNKVIMQKMKWRVKRWMMVIYDDIVRRSKMMLWRMMLRRKTDPKAGTHTLREPALWKCLWRFRRSHFIRKCAGKMLRPRLSPERRHTLCASLRSRNACQDFTRATSCGNLQGKCRGPAGSPKRDPHFVRACAIQIHINISQETSEEPLYTEFYRKKWRSPEWAQNADTQRFHKSHPTLYRNLQEKCRRPKPHRRLRASLRSRNARQDFTRATLYGNLQEKCRRPKPRRRLCASLRSRNTCQDFTGATLHGNLIPSSTSREPWGRF